MFLIRRFTRQLLHALDYADSCGIIHTGKYELPSPNKWQKY
jgi:hypothetical protein